VCSFTAANVAAAANQAHKTATAKQHPTNQQANKLHQSIDQSNNQTNKLYHSMNEGMNAATCCAAVVAGVPHALP
jgi:hypothetical protein